MDPHTVIRGILQLSFTDQSQELNRALESTGLMRHERSRVVACLIKMLGLMALPREALQGYESTGKQGHPHYLLSLAAMDGLLNRQVIAEAVLRMLYGNNTLSQSQVLGFVIRSNPDIEFSFLKLPHKWLSAAVAAFVVSFSDLPEDEQRPMVDALLDRAKLDGPDVLHQCLALALKRLQSTQADYIDKRLEAIHREGEWPNIDRLCRLMH